jgi:hypothetical protein
MQLRDYSTTTTLGHLTYYVLVPFSNHSKVQYRRKYKASLKCNKTIGAILGWLWVKTGAYVYD